MQRPGCRGDLEWLVASVAAGWAAPRQKVAGRKEGHVEKLRTRSTDGRGERFRRQGRGCS